MLEDEFNLVKHAKIFHIQPGAEQWLRLAKHITQCSLFANKATREISLFWYGSSITKRVAGVTKKLRKENVDANPKEWEHAKKWMMLNFGFSGVPIYNISLDVKNVTEEKEEKPKKQGRPTKKEDEERRSKLTEEERKQEDEERERKRKQRKEREEKKRKKEEEEAQTEKEEIQNQPKRKQGRPTKKEEEERRSKLMEEQIKREEEEKERERKEREEQKKRKLEEMQKEIERRKKLTHEERLQEEKERQEEEKRKQQEEEKRKQQEEEKRKQQEEAEKNKEVVTEEKIKIIIEDFTYFLKKGPTFLSPFNQPTKMYKSVNEKKVKEPPCPKDEIFKYPSKILPETENIQWRFRTEPDHKRIGIKNYLIILFSVSKIRIKKYPQIRRENETQ